LLVKYSEELWEFLELVIGTQDEVQIRRDVMTLYEEVKNVRYHAWDYISGSRKEGFDFLWSDNDVMLSLSYMNVVMQNQGCSNIKCTFIAIDADCQPGFCKLLPFSYIFSQSINDDMCYSRFNFLTKRMKYLTNTDNSIGIKGPCITTTDAVGGFDLCSAFPIDPTSSNELVRRFPTKVWNNVKTEILKKNIITMHVVPKGPPEGDAKGIQWLKSFSVLEQHIVRSLTHVQFCCYGLLKILIRFKIDESDETNDTLSSYHLKTVLFHVLEDIHSDFWIPSNIFYCLWICLTRLALFVKRGVCPSYFVPECNLFLKKGFLEKKYKVQQKLLRILQSGVYDVLSMTEYLSRTNPLSLQPNAPTKLRHFIALSSALKHVKGFHTTYHQCMDSILKVFNLLQNERNDIKRAVLNYLFGMYMRRAGVILYDKYVLYGFTDYLLAAEAAFSVARHSDVSGALHHLATLWYCRGKSKLAIELLSRILTIFST
jgi:hypothetical protein